MDAVAENRDEGHQRLEGRVGCSATAPSTTATGSCAPPPPRRGIYGNDAVEAMYPMTRVDASGATARRQQAQLHAHLPRGPVPAGERLLVGDHVRRQDAAADREPDQPLPDQLADAAGMKKDEGRLADALHPEGFAGQGQGIQLAAGAGRRNLPGDAPLLAEGHAAVDPAARRRHVEAAGAPGRKMT